VKKIIAGLGLVLMGGCGVDWFPAQRTAFTNNSTAFKNISASARMAGNFANHSTSGR
jgi:hypothetical protein